MNEDQLHLEEAHPDFAYASTRSFQHYPPGGDGWMRNRLKSPTEAVLENCMGELAHWMRRKDFPQPRKNWRNSWPYSIDDYFEAVGIRRPPGDPQL